MSYGFATGGLRVRYGRGRRTRSPLSPPLNWGGAPKRTAGLRVLRVCCRTFFVYALAYSRTLGLSFCSEGVAPVARTAPPPLLHRSDGVRACYGFSERTRSWRVVGPVAGSRGATPSHTAPADQAGADTNDAEEAHSMNEHENSRPGAKEGR